MANLPYWPLWLIIYFSVSLSHRHSTQFLSKLNPLSLKNLYRHETRTKTRLQICIFAGRNNSFARTTRASHILVHFFVVLAKTTTRKDYILAFEDNESGRRRFLSYLSWYQPRSFQLKFLDSSSTFYIQNELQ